MNRKWIIRVILLGLTGGIIVSFVLSSITKPTAATFATTTLDGQHMDTRNLQGTPYYIEFWSSNCRSCLADIPNLLTLHHILSAQRGMVILIALKQDDILHVRRATYRLSQAGIRIVHDTDGVIAAQFNYPDIMPYGLLIDRHGHIDHIYVGPLPLNDILNRIHQQSSS